MSLPASRVRAAQREDLWAIKALLSDAGLPTQDLESATRLHFWVIEDGPIVATIGLESYGTVGLLRSLAVARSHRAQGQGKALVECLEKKAQANSVQLLVLLTETAESFFKQLGYQTTDRAHVPDAVKCSAEFSSLCPASAVCMTKPLAMRVSVEPHG